MEGFVSCILHRLWKKLYKELRSSKIGQSYYFVYNQNISRIC